MLNGGMAVAAGQNLFTGFTLHCNVRFINGGIGVHIKARHLLTVKEKMPARNLNMVSRQPDNALHVIN